MANGEHSSKVVVGLLVLIVILLIWSMFFMNVAIPLVTPLMGKLNTALSAAGDPAKAWAGQKKNWYLGPAS